MQSKRIFGKLPRAHLLALSTASLLMGTGLVLHQDVSGQDRKEVVLSLGTDPAPAEPAVLAQASRLAMNPSALPSPAAGKVEALNLAALDTEAPVGSAMGGIAEQAATSGPSDLAHSLDWRSFTVKKGDSMSSLFSKAGLTHSLLYQIDSKLEDKSWARLFPGERIEFGLAEGKLVDEIRVHRSKLESWHIRPTEDGSSYTLEKKIRETEAIPAFASGSIDSVFYTAGQKAGLQDKLIMELATLFGWDVDFVLDIRKGDSFKVIYEDIYLDGKKIGTGDILAAQFINRGETHTAIRFTDSEGRTRYYDENGASVKKAFLRSPIDFARISSHFNLKRKHPVLHRIRAHRGTDYAAGRGTPIKSTGEGKVVFAGVKGGYGNVVVIQHGQAISTLYAHMSQFARGVRSGSKVRQGQVIGYVGSTGLASGPHLHYEFRVNGVHKNPVTVKLPDAHPVPVAEKQKFMQTAQGMLATLDDFSQVIQVANRELGSHNVNL